MSLHDPVIADAATVQRERLWPTVLGGWLLAAVVLVAAAWHKIVILRFPDVDDVMRLLEVRDWLAGQSWWDVSQHRLGGGHFAMHWSRLVDLPLAAVLTLFDPIVGRQWATRIAVVAVPLVTLLCVMALGAATARRMAGPAVGRAAVLLPPLCVPVLLQTYPLRIDHHGWQVVLAMAATLLLLGRPSARTGALTGALLGTLLSVSLEGLPITVAIAGVAALGWAWQPAERRGYITALGWSLVGTAGLLQAATRGPGWSAAVCDAVSPAYLLGFAVAAAGLTLVGFAGRAALPVRIGALVLAGVAAGLCFGIADPVCLAGPFARMNPLAYDVWYRNVSEGRPIWEQQGAWMILNLAMPLVGMIGAVRAWRLSSGEARLRWSLLIGASGAALVLMLLVIRAGATANALAIPGAATVLLALMTRARAVRRSAPRILATVGALTAASPGLAVGLAMALVGPAKPDATQEARRNHWHRPPCADVTPMRSARQLPPGTVFAPNDQSPEVIGMTRHPAISSGYHRNSDAIALVFRAFLSPPADAERLIRSSGSAYVAVCPGLPEPELYRKIAPNGLWGRLERGERVAWLQPVPIRGSPLLAWRVLPRATVPLAR